MLTHWNTIPQNEWVHFVGLLVLNMSYGFLSVAEIGAGSSSIKSHKAGGTPNHDEQPLLISCSTSDGVVLTVTNEVHARHIFMLITGKQFLRLLHLIMDSSLGKLVCILLLWAEGQMHIGGINKRLFKAISMHARSTWFSHVNKAADLPYLVGWHVEMKGNRKCCA